ncbi:hypothetical protein [Amycolatopsis taiwanensis]|uniref:hypothetical protein n=1 Tax=Amycolatopsis taiwanensis TaxID=342230 RepID=UPI0012EC2107|nr:hypothetical protein [Amycolatopsis taiwanensis]
MQRADGGDFWVAEGTQITDDGTIRRRYMFPAETLEWRAAEYGIDPTDRATLLDIVLAEPHLTPEDWSTGSQLHTAPDIDTARADHISRCAATKWRNRIGTRAVGNPCRQIAEDSPMDAEAIDLKRQLVEHQRARIAEQAAPATSAPDRIAALRAALGRK